MNFLLPYMGKFDTFCIFLLNLKHILFKLKIESGPPPKCSLYFTFCCGDKAWKCVRNHQDIVFYVRTQHTHGALSRWEPSTHQLLTGGGGGGEGRWCMKRGQHHDAALIVIKTPSLTLIKLQKHNKQSPEQSWKTKRDLINQGENLHEACQNYPA